MPGRRLSDEDREYIAAGLADGLEYAEIARRLARPTSTVTREIARNGGPGGYRAEWAIRATIRRASRRRSTPAPEIVDTTPDAYGRDPDAVQDLQEQCTAMMVQTGLPRMAARVLACLYITDTGSLTAADLVHRLRVSPASISKAVGYLEGLELVRRERDTGRRRERYVIDDDVWLRSWTASMRSNAMWVDLARKGTDVLGLTTPAGVRMEGVRQFFDRLHQDMLVASARATAGDALTVLAAIMHAAEPLTVDELAAALGWRPDRVASALRDVEESPEIAGPVAVRRTEGGACTVVARLDRLSTAQREALERPALALVCEA